MASLERVVGMDFSKKLAFDTQVIESQLCEDLGGRNCRQKEYPVKKGLGIYGEQEEGWCGQSLKRKGAE